MLCIVGKKGSRAVKDLIALTGIKRYVGNKHNKVKIIINYGLAGKNLKLFYAKYRSATKLPMMNKRIGYKKLTAINMVSKVGVPVPESRLSIPQKESKDGWLIKRQHSIGGKGIKIADTRKERPNLYYQKRVSRKFELRVHVFLWQEKVYVQKRIGDESAIAWNYSQGGTFQNVNHPEKYRVFVEATELAKKVLTILGMAFGAVDFLVDDSYNVLFIEVNSAPGFTEFSQNIYKEAFINLKNLPLKQIMEYSYNV